MRIYQSHTSSARSYLNGCRCFLCQEAWAEYHYEWAHRPDDGHLALAREARAWAKRYGIAVPKRGRMPARLIKRYKRSKTYRRRHGRASKTAVKGEVA